MPSLLTITGPTASGKTSLAVAVARAIDGEIISADSRQVFRGMDIGTGKDLSEYSQGGAAVPYHLIDIHDPGYEYNAYQFQNDFIAAYHRIVDAGHQSILCGGTGLYIDAVVRNFPLANAPVDEAFRASVADIDDEELTRRLAALAPLHNHTDTEDRNRLIRALEIQEYARQHPQDHVVMPSMEHIVVAVEFPRDLLIQRIEQRLRQRLEAGMVEEVQRLIDNGVDARRLMRYGLEYRHLTRYLLHECSYEQMYEELFRDIRRFAKRQMTYLRHMERNGVNIHWIDGREGTEQLSQQILCNYFHC